MALQPALMTVQKQAIRPQGFATIHFPILQARQSQKANALFRTMMAIHD
jgi:hypothetical protein